MSTAESAALDETEEADARDRAESRALERSRARPARMAAVPLDACGQSRRGTHDL